MIFKVIFAQSNPIYIGSALVRVCNNLGAAVWLIAVSRVKLMQGQKKYLISLKKFLLPKESRFIVGKSFMYFDLLQLLKE